MKRVNVKRYLALLLCVFMLIPLSVIAVAADEEYIPIKWKMDPNVEYLYGDEKRYDRYVVNGAFYNDASFTFYFSNTATYNGKECTVYGDSAYPHIVSVKKGDGYSFVFVDDTGKKILDDFVAGKDCIYYLEDFGKTYTVIEKSLVNLLDREYNNYSSINTVRMDAWMLKDGEAFEITSHDATETKAYQYGAIFKMPDGKFYYLPFKDLDNSHFDADGYFSYRSGEVKLIKLDGDSLTRVKSALSSMETRQKTNVYETFVIKGVYDVYGEKIEDDYDFGETSDVGTEILFWVSFIFVGFIVPIIPLAIGLIFPRLKSLGKNRYWYIVAGFAAMWLLASVGMLMIIFM